MVKKCLSMHIKHKLDRERERSINPHHLGLNITFLRKKKTQISNISDIMVIDYNTQTRLLSPTFHFC